ELLLLLRLDAAVRGLQSDQELRYRAGVEALIQLRDAAHNGLHQRQLGDELGAGFGKGNREPPGGRRPVKQWNVAPGDALQREVGIVIERRGEARVTRVKAAHPIVISADVEL